MRILMREPLILHQGKVGFRGNVWKKRFEKYAGVHQVSNMGKHFNKRIGKEYKMCGETDSWNFKKGSKESGHETSYVLKKVGATEGL